MIVRLSNLVITKLSERFEEFERGVFREIRRRMTLDDLKNDARFRSYRDLYWTFGMDPTKLRVSSEALVRRVLRGENLWRVSSLVDVANLSSARHALPIGLIDFSTISGGLEIRAARKEEVFTRIGGKTLTCRGREIVLADAEKIICFGYATHDSDVTKVTPTSREVLLLIYGAPVVSKEEIHSAMALTLSMVREWVQCEIGESHLFTSNA